MATFSMSKKSRSPASTNLSMLINRGLPAKAEKAL
jgi:hypothetical protein